MQRPNSRPAVKARIRFDVSKLVKDLDQIGKEQLPFAAAQALTKTAQGAKIAVQASMKSTFDRPTPFTLNSLYVQPATKKNLVATVKFKDYNTKGAPPSVFIQPQVEGGTRNLKRSEILLRGKGILPGGMFWVPGSGAKLDQYGNMSRGQLQQILSATQSFANAGFSANRTGNSFDRSKTQVELLVGKPAGGHLPLGIYMRTGGTKGQPAHLTPLMIFVNTPHYSARLPFQSTVDGVFRADFPTIFKNCFDAARSSASNADTSFTF